MYAIEFETKLENDGNIKIPEIYRNRLNGNVKVIILKQEEDYLNEASQPGHCMAEILQSIAEEGGLGIADPIAWQQEVRCERVLPLREE